MGLSECVRANLSPRWGLDIWRFYPRLAPWAAFLRRSAAESGSVANWVRRRCGPSWSWPAEGAHWRLGMSRAYGETSNTVPQP
jgi:hypothetical protein